MNVPFGARLVSLLAQGASIGRPRSAPTDGRLEIEDVATALYRAILEREPDPVGLSHNVDRLRTGSSVEEVVRTFISSPEFRARVLRTITPIVELPDLRLMMPEMYRKELRGGALVDIYAGRTDADIARMAMLIEKYRYYDMFGVWSPLIDFDKEITAAIVRGLGAHSCFEVGCFTGSVLSLLAESGICVAGSEISHTAFTFAYPNVRAALLFGDLLSLNITRHFDIILCLDVLEHLQPMQLDCYIEKIKTLLTNDGFVYVNSPMYGNDPVFGTVFDAYLKEWRSCDDGSFWRHWPCDEKGWPEHGHLIWASANWWLRRFEAHGLVRSPAIERVLHRHLAGFFELAPARRSLFVLSRPGNASSAAAAAQLDDALRRMPNLPRPRSAAIRRPNAAERPVSKA